MKRIVTAAVGIPVVIALTLYSPHWLFALVIAVLAAVCFHELMAFAPSHGGLKPGAWSAIAAAAITASFVGDPKLVLLMTVVAFMFCLVVMAAEGGIETLLPHMSRVALGLLYCGVLLGFVVWLYAHEVLVLLATIWAGDSAAYYAGRALGRHKLAPSISPNKTVEGSIAGLIASTIAGVALGMWLLHLSPFSLARAALASAVAGQVGDLVESAMKRSAGVKDSSSLLPGHGGMLDRLDSLLFAAPVFYWFVRP